MTPRGGILRQDFAIALTPPQPAGLHTGPGFAPPSPAHSNELHLEEFEMPAEPAPSTGADSPEASHMAWGARERALRERWEEELRAEAARAHARGVAEGRAQAAAEAAQLLQQPADALRTAATQVRAHEEKFIGQLEENLAAVAVAIARQIIGREVNTDPAAVAVLVRRAVAEFPVDQALRIRVHPADLALLTTARDANGAPMAVVGGREVAWLADPRLERGGCIVEGRERIVDGRVDEALERVFRRLARLNA